MGSNHYFFLLLPFDPFEDLPLPFDPLDFLSFLDEALEPFILDAFEFFPSSSSLGKFFSLANFFAQDSGSNSSGGIGCQVSSREHMQRFSVVGGSPSSGISGSTMGRIRAFSRLK